MQHQSINCLISILAIWCGGNVCNAGFGVTRHGRIYIMKGIEEDVIGFGKASFLKPYLLKLFKKLLKLLSILR